MTNDDGTQALVVPEQLPLELFYRWLRAEAIRIAEASLLETPQEEMAFGIVDEGPELLEPEPDPLHVVLAQEEDGLLLHLEAVATPQQRQLLKRIERGMKRADAARALGISPSTARVRFGRLRNTLASIM